MIHFGWAHALLLHAARRPPNGEAAIAIGEWAHACGCGGSARFSECMEPRRRLDKKTAIEIEQAGAPRTTAPGFRPRGPRAIGQFRGRITPARPRHQR